jgi:hypothetical protein
LRVKRISAAGEDTLVELEHGNLERHGIGTEKLRAIFDSPTAWEGILASYARAAGGSDGNDKPA